MQKQIIFFLKVKLFERLPFL